jgi:mannose-1-phosphate guanylyltransferase
MSSDLINAVILAGGSGTRFWPLSRLDRPKQFLALEGERSLLRATADRLLSWMPAERIWVCTTERLRAGVLDQLPEVPAEQVLAEPEGRNTAPAIGWSIQRMAAAGQDGVVGVFSADHRIADDRAFEQAVKGAAAVAERDDRVMTLGVAPRWAETGYGYLELGATLEGENGLREVRRFTEKPDQATAERFVASGDYYWNTGIFIFRGASMLAHLRRFEPELIAGLEEIERSPDRLAEIYPRLPSVSIDVGVMERLDDMATLPLECGWSDLGSWAALAEILPTDETGNARHGSTLAVESSGNLLWAEEGTVAVIGVEGLVVVKTGDAVLVVPRERSQEVRKVIEQLVENGRDDLR